MTEMLPEQYLKELSRREAALQKQEEAMIDAVTMQSILLVLLRLYRKGEKLKPAMQNEIRHAKARHAAGDYFPKAELDRLLADTVLDREDRKHPL